MPRYQVSFVSRVWVDTEVIAPDRHSAEDKAQEKIDQHMDADGFNWLDGENEVCGTINLSLLKKVPS